MITKGSIRPLSKFHFDQNPRFFAGFFLFEIAYASGYVNFKKKKSHKKSSNFDAKANYERGPLYRLFLMILFFYPLNFLHAKSDFSNEPIALLSLGGGYLDAGPRHSGGCVQMEYKWDYFLWNCIRPQFSIAMPGIESVFVGFGVACEIYFGDHIVFSPNFEPGLYYFDHGRDLGSAIEFRSCIECAYEFNNKIRLGGQFWHISNAGIGWRNPGENAAIIFIAYPISL